MTRAGHRISFVAALTLLAAFPPVVSTLASPLRDTCARAPVRPRPLARPCAPDTAALQRLLTAEDSRGTGAEGLTPLLDALSSPDTLLRRVAVRGVGRMQRPALGKLLVPLLHDAADRKSVV